MTQKIENFSFADNLIRLIIPIGISYGSDLKKAITLTVQAAMNIDRVLKVPDRNALYANSVTARSICNCGCGSMIPKMGLPMLRF